MTIPSDMAGLFSAIEDAVKAGQDSISVPFQVGSIHLALSGELHDGTTLIGLDAKSAPPTLGDLLTFAGVDDLAGTNGACVFADLSAMSISDIAVQFQGSPFQIVALSMTVTLPGLNVLSMSVPAGANWQIVIFDPLGSARAVQSFIQGGAPLGLSMGIDLDELSLNIQMPSGDTIELTDLIEHYLGGALTLPKDTPAIKITYGRASGNVKQETFDFEASAKAIWTIPGASTDFNLDINALSLSKTAENTTFGLSASSTFAGEAITLDLAISDTLLVQGTFNEIPLGKLINALLAGFHLSAGLPDVSLEGVSLSVLCGAGQNAFSVGTAVPNFGTMLFKYQASPAGLVIGFKPPDAWKPSNIPNFPNCFDLINFSDNILVYSSTTPSDSSNAFPQTSDFKDPKFAPATIKLPREFPTVQEGINFYSNISLNDGNLARLSKILGGLPGGGLTICLNVDLAGPSGLLSASLDGVSFLDGKSGKNTLSISEATLQVGMRDEILCVGVHSNLTVNVNGHDLTFTDLLKFEDTGVVFSAGLPNWPDAFGIKGLNASDIAIELGIDYEGVPTIGLQAILNIGEYDGGFAIIFDSTDPTKCTLNATISDIDVGNIVKSFAPDASIPGLFGSALSSVELSGTQQFALEPSTAEDLEAKTITPALITAFNAHNCNLPTDPKLLSLQQCGSDTSWFLSDTLSMKTYKVVLKSGKLTAALDAQLIISGNELFFDGALSAFGGKATGRIDVNRTQGIALDLSLTPIKLAGVLSVTGKGKNGGPDFSVSTYSRPGAPNPDPHFIVSGDGSLAGVFSGRIDVYMEDQLYKFDLTASIFNAFSATINASASAAASGADFSLQVTIDVGDLKQVEKSIQNTLKKAADSAESAMSNAAKDLDAANAYFNEVQNNIDSDQRQINRKSKYIKDHPWDVAKDAEYAIEIAGLEAAEKLQQGYLITAKTAVDQAKAALKDIGMATNAVVNVANSALTGVGKWLSGNSLDKLLVIKEAGFGAQLGTMSGAEFDLSLGIEFMGKPEKPKIHVDLKDINTIANELLNYITSKLL